MKEFLIIITLILAVGFTGHYGRVARDENNIKEYHVWEKVMGNPNDLTLEEYITYK